jgi:undecaprenyl-phosphate galactose phosphotransferase/putative colanic acid biosynthesis UDP-glucose lipid carrier transferase
MPLDCAQDLAWQADPRLREGAARLGRAKLKRFVDVVGTLVGLLLLSPFLIAVAILIKVESKGPVFFRQRRTGYDGAAFAIYKFRTMAACEDGPIVVQATRNDCRTTRLGSFLRRTSIDELPNLINVLRGEMSLVGPRPHAVPHDRYWSMLVPEYEGRFMVRPGLTGLAQVEGYRGGTPDVESMAARVSHDLDYIRTWSMRLDVEILLRTLLIGPFDPAAY